MNRLSLLLAVCQSVAAGELRADDAPAQPNIIILLVDDLGYAELGCQGNTDVPTPHIDSLARDGVRFTAGYVTAPFCSASRAGLLTGRYQTRFGYEFNPIGAQNADPAIGLPPETTTLAERLHEAGYATGLVGKWHLGGTAAYHPQRAGFDEFYGFLHEGHTYAPPTAPDVSTWLRRKSLPNGGQGRWTSDDGRLVLSTHLRHDEPPYDADNPILRSSQPVAETEYLTDAVTREAVRFIERHPDRPYFLHVAYNAVHSPMQARQDDLAKFTHIEDIQRRLFAAMLSRLDAGVGRILRSLSESGQADRTLVWFLSDNGGPTRELTSSNSPLRGGKGELYEGGIRVPFLLRWPARTPAGRVEDQPVISLDISATSLGAAGIEAGELDGVNLRPWLGGPQLQAPHARLYWRVGRRAALRAGEWKLVRRPERAGEPQWELYNLEQDPAETQNLAGKSPEVLRRLIEQWQSVDSTMQPPRWAGER